MGNKTITTNDLQRMKNSVLLDKNFRIVSNAVQNNGVFDSAFNTQESFKLQPIFNVEVKDMSSVTNQKKSGRCWMFAGLNILREIVKKNLHVKDIELSESYLMFYDKLEKTNTTLEYIIKHINEPIDSRVLRYDLLLSGDNDGGFWHYFVKLVKKYGICPKEAMGETDVSSRSCEMNILINTVVTKYISLIRKNSKDLQVVYDLKENALQEVYKILAICIGLPVDEFTFDFELEDDKKNKNEDKKKDEDEEKKVIKTIKTTPLEFSKTYLSCNLDDYVILTNYPSLQYPFYQTYTNKGCVNMMEETSKNAYKSLNVPINLIKETAIKSLKDNTPLWFACDVTSEMYREEGYLATEVSNISEMFGVEFKYDKMERALLLNSECNHAMTLTGVHLDSNNAPVRWKVQNSWGEDVGKKGIFIMSDEWFSEYVYECIVDKKYLNDDIIEAYNKEPVVLEPWSIVC